MNNRIRQIRDFYDLSRAAFGDRIGVSGDVINNLERGRVEAKEFHIKSICREYHINEEWLRKGTGTMFEPVEAPVIMELMKNTELTDQDKATINTFLQLPEEYKKMFADYIRLLYEKQTAELKRYAAYEEALKKASEEN